MNRHQKRVRVVALVLAILSLISAIYYFSAAVTGFNKTESDKQAVFSEKGVYIGILRYTARDGTPIKALMYVPAEYWDINSESIKNTTTNPHSVPIAILCHGMSSDYLIFDNLGYTLAKDHGFAAFSVEARGHGSNPAPSTLGAREPLDIIDLLDYIDIHFNLLDTNRSVIMGHSMGALDAMLAYIHESNGKGRLKGCVAGSGPLNLTREQEMIATTDDIKILGNMSIMEDLDKKNPVDLVNTTFPRNIVIFHGTADTLVDYQCAIDFLKKVDPAKIDDPNAGRDDVYFFSLPDVPHSLPEDFLKYTILYFNHLVNGGPFEVDNQTLLDSIEIHRTPIDYNAARKAQEDLMFACISLMILLPAIIFIIFPDLFNKSIYNPSGEKDGDENTHSESPNDKKADENSDHGQGEDGFSKTVLRLNAIILLYILSLITGLLALLSPIYLATKMTFLTVPLLLYIYILTSKRMDRCKWRLCIYPHESRRASIAFGKAVNPINAVITGSSVAAFFITYIAIKNSQDLENRVLVPGTRNIMWFYLIWFFITLFMVFVICFVRGLRSNPPKLGILGRITEPISVFLITFLIIFGFLTPIVGKGSIIIPAWFDFYLDVGLGLSLIFALLFAIFDIMIQIGEIFTRSIVPGAIGVAILIPYFAALSRIMLIL